MDVSHYDHVPKQEEDLAVELSDHVLSHDAASSSTHDNNDGAGQAQGSGSHSVSGGSDTSKGTATGKAADPPGGVSKRTMQNRKAQRDFRLRRATYVKDLEERVRRYEIEQFNNKVAMQNERTELYRLREENGRLLDENQRLRSHIERPTGEERLPSFIDTSSSFPHAQASYMGGYSGGSTSVLPPQVGTSMSHAGPSKLSSIDYHSRPQFGASTMTHEVGVPALPNTPAMFSNAWDTNRRQSDTHSRSISDNESPHSQSASSTPLSPMNFPSAAMDTDASHRQARTAMWHSSIQPPVSFGGPLTVDDAARRRPQTAHMGMPAPSLTQSRPNFGGLAHPAATIGASQGTAHHGRISLPVASHSPVMYANAGSQARSHAAYVISPPPPPQPPGSSHTPASSFESLHSAYPTQPSSRPPSGDYTSK